MHQAAPAFRGKNPALLGGNHFENSLKGHRVPDISVSEGRQLEAPGHLIYPAHQGKNSDEPPRVAIAHGGFILLGHVVHLVLEISHSFWHLPHKFQVIVTVQAVDLAAGGVSVESFDPSDLKHGTGILIHGHLDSFQNVVIGGDGFPEATPQQEGGKENSRRRAEC